MFTGIVQTKAQLTEIRDKAQFRQLTVQTEAEHLAKLERGASVAINGVCLTVTEFDCNAGWVCFDVIDETLAKKDTVKNSALKKL